MDRVEKAGLGIALAGHAALFALLSLRLMPVPPALSTERPIEVSLVEDVAERQAAPPAPTPPSVSQAPEQGPPEDAAPPPPVEAVPAPVPKPAPMAKPQPAPVAKPAPVKPAPAKAVPAKPAPHPDRLASVVADASRPTTRPRGSRLGSDFLKGLSDAPSKAPPSAAAPGAAMNAKAAADIGSAILRQVQPCADRQVNPGPGAERIRVAINLRLNRDGSLAGAPRIVGHDGVDDDNRRYLARVDDLAIATFTGCAPLAGLPAALYDVPNGWRSFTLRYKLPG